MFRPARSLLSIAFLVGGLWIMFSVDLGGLTFAEHMDTISETPEAKQLVKGARSKVNPALQELRDRVLGEYVEAPTWIPSEPGELGPWNPGPASTAASTLEPGSNFEPSLPGRHPARVSSEANPPEPALPGRRSSPAWDDEDPSPEPALPGHRFATALDEEPSLEPALPGRR